MHKHERETAKGTTIEREDKREKGEGNDTGKDDKMKVVRETRRKGNGGGGKHKRRDE